MYTFFSCWNTTKYIEFWHICFQFLIVQMPNNDKLYTTGGRKRWSFGVPLSWIPPPYISVSAYIYIYTQHINGIQVYIYIYTCAVLEQKNITLNYLELKHRSLLWPRSTFQSISQVPAFSKTRTTWATKKKHLLSMKYWLVHRDPYNGLLCSLYNWVV